MALGARKRWPWVTVPLVTSPWRDLDRLAAVERRDPAHRAGEGDLVPARAHRLLEAEPGEQAREERGEHLLRLLPLLHLGDRRAAAPWASRSAPGRRPRPPGSGRSRAPPAWASPRRRRRWPPAGPSASVLASACRAATSRAQTTSRRGVPMAFTSPWVRRASASSLAQVLLQLLQRRRHEAGRDLLGADLEQKVCHGLSQEGRGGYAPAVAAASRAARAASTAAARALGGSSGKPSASRDSR